ncbi:MAG: site-2 protease family protein [Thiotrichales bacterium]|nr:MAG: site-2 protease family protein [Thiotrichales bacterium]
MQQTLYTIAIWAVPVLFAITLHEAAHGWVANKLGDPTARQLGRITANPIKHIDLVGTVIIPLVLALSRSGFIFGWAKPVPVDPRHFKQPLLDMALVALAGPVSNFVMACGWALVITLGKTALADSSMAIHLIQMGKAGMLINIVLMVLNLVPIPPLDGGRVIAGVLPKDVALAYMRIEPFGMWIIIALLFSGLLGKILWPVVLRFDAIISAIFIF